MPELELLYKYHTDARAGGYAKIQAENIDIFPSPAAQRRFCMRD